MVRPLPRLLRPLLVGLGLFFGFVAHAHVDGERYVTFAPTPGAFSLVGAQGAATFVVDAHDWPGLIRAVGDVRSDLRRITGQCPAQRAAVDAAPLPHVVIVGTISRSRVIDALISAGKIDVSPIRGQWESWVRQVVLHPAPGVETALVIAGSDKRGTIYGVYDLAQQAGVSPWYWWADLPVEHHDALYVSSTRFVQGPPSVKYRGIFLNDEAPDLTHWIQAKFGSAPVRTDPPVPAGIANYGHDFYARLFEVLLRLRANYLWPAMWNNAFNEDDPDNARLADEYGIVMGTSHQEPMLRAQKEWDRRYQRILGSWNYAKNPEVLEQFWREGVRRNRSFESIITLGLRGANDTEMAPGGPVANRALLERIVDRQRGILQEEMSPDVPSIPQLWCLYKEVQDYYDDGMRVPDDVTLLWADDNWGNLRRLPTAAERTRPGGAGVYYHFDYHGGPRSYQWINTNPLPKIWEQLSLAQQYGADRIWIVNAGHFKGYEVPIEFFLDLAWDSSRWNAETIGDFRPAWAAREFGPAHAKDIAYIVAGYAKANARRKPELLAPTTYSLTNYHEAEEIVADFRALADHAQRISDLLPAERRDAFYQLVLFPTQASAVVNELYVAAGRNQLYAAQGRASATHFATEVRRWFEADQALMAHFNHTFADGRWAHFMDQPHLGYTTWRDPPTNSLAAITLSEPTPAEGPSQGVALEGSSNAWPRSPELGEPPSAQLPAFDALNRQRRYIEVFVRGREPFEFSAAANEPWVRLSETAGSLGPDHRLWVDIDWSHAPQGRATAAVSVRGAGAEVVVGIAIINLAPPQLDSQWVFVEDAGAMAIDPSHATALRSSGRRSWTVLPDYGRTGSALRAEGPIDTPAAMPETDAPVAEYRLYTYASGPAVVHVVSTASLPFQPHQPLRCAVSFDNEKPVIVTVVPAGFQAQNGNTDWERTVSDNARTTVVPLTLKEPGSHSLKIWMVDPGLVIERLLLDLGGLRPSYLGPRESRWPAPPETTPRPTQ